MGSLAGDKAPHHPARPRDCPPITVRGRLDGARGRLRAGSRTSLLAGVCRTALVVGPAVLSLGVALAPAHAQTTLAPSDTGVTLSSAGNPFIVDAGTLIDNATSGSDAVFGGTLSNTGAWTITNSGTLNGATAGVRLNLGATVVNNATITGGAFSVYISGVGTVTNTGSIIGTGSSSQGVYLFTGGVVVNQGSTALITGGSYGVQTRSGTGTVINTGTIIGTSRYGVRLIGNGSVANLGSTALISGGVGGVAIDGQGSVTNSGTIIASSTIGHGVFTSGFVANQGSAALIFGGDVGVYFVGDSGNNTVLNAGTISGGRGTAVQFADGNDLLILKPGAVFNGVVDGGDGSNIIWLQGAHGTIHDIRPGGEYLSFQTLSVANGAYWTHLGTSTLANTYVLGTFGNLGTFNGGVTLINGGSLYNRRQGGNIGTIIGYDGVVGVGGGARVTNAGTIIGAGYAGVYLTAGGSIANQGSAARIYGTYAGVGIKGGAGTVTNSGTIVETGDGFNSAGVLLAAGGSVANQGTAALIQGVTGVLIESGGALVTNTGTIIGTDVAAVWLRSGGSITNQGSAAFISGGLNGVVTQGGPGRVTNTGTIVATVGYGFGVGVNLGSGGTVRNEGLGADISSSGEGILIQQGAGTVINSGTVTGGSYGVGLRVGGSIANQGSAALISGGVNGIFLIGPSTVTNTGMITGRTGTGVSALDLYATYSNTVLNAGTISGGNGTAVKFGAGNDLLILQPGAVFNGTVDGAAGSNTILLQGSHGTISGVGPGGEFVNFQNLTVAQGGYWTFMGSSTLVNVGNQGTLGNGGSITDTRTFDNSGLILGPGALVETGAGALFRNSGTVRTAVTLANGAGLYNQHTGGKTGTILGGPYGVVALGGGDIMTNAGSISGTVAGVLLSGGGSLANLPGGRITGGQYGVEVSGGPGTISNQGVILDALGAGILLMAGGSVGNGGSIGGQVGVRSYGGSATITNSGVIQGTSGPGVQFQDQGGTFLNTLVNTGTIIGSNGTAVQFGAADDVLALQPGGVFIGVVDGGGGTNTILLQGTRKNAPGLGGYINFQDLSVANGAYWGLGGASTFVDTTLLGTLVINGSFTSTGSFGDQGVLLDKGSFVNNGQFEGPGGLTAMGSGAVVTNNATIATTVTLANGGSLVNQAGALVAGGAYGVVIPGGAGGFGNQGTVSGRSGVLLTSAAPVLANQGTILGGTLTGVEFLNAGRVGNGTTAAASPAGLPLIYGYTNGVAMQGTAGNQVVSNFGTIRTGSTAAPGPVHRYGVFAHDGVTLSSRDQGTVNNKGVYALIYGYRNGVEIAATAGYVLNQGTISGGHGVGVSLAAGTMVNKGNKSLIYGRTVGVTIAGAGYVMNQGTITGRNGAGVRLSGSGSTLVNAGLIQGKGTAVRLSGGSDLLVLQTGAQFSGIVDGGAGSDGIQLQGSGTIHDIRSGGQYVNFETLTMSGGYWQLAGTNAITDTDVSQGRLAVMGTLTGPVQVGSGGTLGGSGRVVGAVTIGNGGTVAPGTKAGTVTTVGTLNVTGTVTLTANGHFQTQVDGASRSDQLKITGGAVFQGGTVDVVENVHAVATAYTIVNTTTGILGGLPTVDVGAGSSAFLTPTLSFDPGHDDLLLTLMQTAALSTAATTHNQQGVAAALGVMEVGVTKGGSGGSATGTGGTSSGSVKSVPASAPSAAPSSTNLLPLPSGERVGVRGPGDGHWPAGAAASPTSPRLSPPPGGGGGGGGQLAMPALALTMGGASAAPASPSSLGTTASAAPTGNGALIDALLLLNKSSAQGAFDQLAGELHADLSQVQIRSALMFGDALSQQMQLSHGDLGGMNLLAARGTSRFSLGADGRAYDLVQSPGAAPAASGPWSAWASGFGTGGGITGEGGVHSLNYSIGAGAWGLDYRVSPRLVVGGAWGYADGSVGAQGLAGTGRVKSQQFGGYASYQGEGWYLDGQLGYAHNEDAVRRLVSFPGFAGLAEGNTRADQAMAGLEAGLPLPVAPKTVLTPYLGLQATSFRQAAFSEAGGGSIDLAAQGMTASSVRSLLGGQVSHAFDLGEGKSLAIEGRLAWAHEYVPGGGALTAGFASAPSASFAVQGAAPRRDSAVMRLGVAASLSPATSLYLRYDGDIDGRDDAHAVQAGMRFVW